MEKDGYNLLMRYVFTHHEQTDPDAIKQLLRVGVDPNYQTAWGSNALIHCYQLDAP